jgi:ATP-dependent helicase HrpB
MNGTRPELPIDSSLPEVLDAIRQHRRLVLVAQPGAGKTTRVAPALLKAGILAPEHPNLVLLQPRRVATRSVAGRIGEENGWAVGEEVGYQVRFERRIGPRTRLHVMTEGILNRKLVADPFLEGIGAVLLDEFHERSIHTDLALAFLREIRDSVREDLILIVMSATLDAEPVAKFLGDAPIVRVEGRTFPVEISYQGSNGDSLPDRMARAIEAALPGERGPGSDILAFLPGAEEIRRTARALAPIAAREGVLVLPLHGSLPADEQDRAIRPGNQRKIVLATNIAETSLTIDGVSTVIDGGVARVASFDAERGIDRLELRRISRASATQRAGRAGRTRPGRCVRLWSERDERGMAVSDRPEIDRIDLAATLLAVHAWGVVDPATFAWFESPQPDRLAAADAVLRMLGAVDTDGKISPIGRDLLDCPAPPRTALLLREASRAGLARPGATLAALLSERDIVLRPDRPGARGAARPVAHGVSDLFVRLDAFDDAERRKFAPGLRDQGIDPMAARRVAQARDDLLRIARRWPQTSAVNLDEDALLQILLVAFPDRVCRRRTADPSAGLMVGGRGVRLEPDSVVRDGEFFLALDPRADDRGVNREARVRIASLVRPEWLTRFFPEAVRLEKGARFDDERGRVVGEHRLIYRDLTIEEHEHVAVEPEVASRVLADALRPRAEDLIRENEAAGPWLARYQTLTRIMPDLGLPPLDEAAFSALIDAACRGRRTREEVRKAPWLDLLRGTLTYQQARSLDDLAPEALTVPSGSRIRLLYEPDRPPVLAVRLQELFGWLETPRIAGGRVAVVLHLLGPNYRPVQVTDDLRSFWSSAYFQVRKDLRNRYPKHSWPEDPLSARAEARGARRPST